VKRIDFRGWVLRGVLQEKKNVSTYLLLMEWEGVGLEVDEYEYL
jgi:hypothetical protein